MAIDNGGPAFPREDYQANNAPGQSGMSLRDWFAGQVVSTLIWKCEETDGGWSPENVAAGSYALADAMLAARKRGNNNGTP